MDRVGFKMKFKPGCQDEYKKHDTVWSELKELLTNSGISADSIYPDEEMDALFAVRRQSGDSASQDFDASPTAQNSWTCSDEIMDTNIDNSPVARHLKEVFYLE
jgi:L-rhamnose mutarotase